MKDVPKKYEKMTARAKTSRKAAIRMCCIECMGYDEREVKGCTSPNCPLFRWRITG